MDLNFRDTYNKASEMEADEKKDRYPPRFIIEVMKSDDIVTCCMRRVECKISCHGKDDVIFDNVLFNIIISPKRLPKASGSTIKSK